MKCIVHHCQEDAVVHVIHISNRKALWQKDVCDQHVATIPPFSEPEGCVTSLASNKVAGLSRFEPDFLIFFDKCEADGLRLREVGGSKLFSIPIGRYETWSICRALQALTELENRPYTFAAFAMVVEALGGKLEQVVVDAIDGEGDYYHSQLIFRQGDELVAVDVRPSDSFALAIACNAPILIADTVLARAEELGWNKRLI
jgi:bifunctional DNase/RNase